MGSSPTGPTFCRSERYGVFENVLEIVYCAQPWSGLTQPQSRLLDSVGRWQVSGHLNPVLGSLEQQVGRKVLSVTGRRMA